MRTATEPATRFDWRVMSFASAIFWRIRTVPTSSAATRHPRLTGDAQMQLPKVTGLIAKKGNTLEVLSLSLSVVLNDNNIMHVTFQATARFQGLEFFQKAIKNGVQVHFECVPPM